MCYSFVGGTGMCSFDDRLIISIILLFQTQTCLTRYPVIWYPLQDIETFVSSAS